MPEPGKQAKPREVPVAMVQFVVVDDHAFVRHIVNECLKANKVRRYTGCQDGAEALQLLTKMSPKAKLGAIGDSLSDRPDIAGDLYPESADFRAAHAYCVITDFNMPKMNGLQLLKAIRCGDTGIPRDTPVILLTGYSEEFVVSAALQLDVNAFTVKPVSRNALWEKIERVLKAVSPVREIATYKTVAIPDADGQVIDGEARKEKAAAEKEVNDDGISMLPLSAVLPGSVLARDLKGDRGALLLRGGTVFTKNVLQKLLDLEKMDGLTGNIPIRKPPA